MARVIVLDTGPLWVACGVRDQGLAHRIAIWLIGLQAFGSLVAIPEIADHEVRRKFIKEKKRAQLRRLDQLCRNLAYVPITSKAMRRAARLWAGARTAGQPTAGEEGLDGDDVLTAQALGFVGHRDELIVATSNDSHLSRYIPDARSWQEITP